MRRSILTLLLLAFYFMGSAQDNPRPGDTLSEVIVNAFETNKELMKIAAPVAVLNQVSIERSDNSSMVDAINMLPGLNMDERSPGSYRLNFRGSSVRSTFGVRNVKVYYNGIPFTSATGNTALQMLGFYNFGEIEFVKGPAGSMYGSGSGGVMMISDLSNSNEKRVSYTYGSFNTQSILGEINISDSNRSFALKYNRQSSNGYRDYTSMHRDVVTANLGIKKTSKQQIGATFLYSNLFYQTPGGLTLSEYEANPRSARPKSGIFESSAFKKASLNLYHFLLGINSAQQISRNLSNKTVIYGTYDYGVSPTIRNYNRAGESGVGARTDFSWSRTVNGDELKLDAGGEYQLGLYSHNEFQNIGSGKRGPLNSVDEIINTQAFAYVQAQLNLRNGFSFNAGSSINFFPVDYRQFYPETIKYHRKFKNQIVPRLAILKDISNKFSVYALMSKGFSPPTITELLPTNRVFNTTLEPEESVNFEIGGRASLIQRRLFIDLSLFSMKIRNSLVQNQDNGGGTFFVNAGRAVERGVEAMVNFYALQKPVGLFSSVLLNVGTNLYHFRYKEFRQTDEDFSGNKMPGTSPVKLTGSIDVGLKGNFRISVLSLYNSKIALNDANSAYADPYVLLSGKVAKRLTIRNGGLKIFAGVQNLLDETYSLGNDINAIGGRYYNVAPGISFYGGMEFSF